jgi:hypoxanthine phosphoribosyltransferase|tara:strand:+ start:31 stop:561 length:531 start_codon:yes stop_codon:yes gene_type:complete
MGNKLHINWSTYNELCEKLILKIAKSGYEIDLIIAIMRGGAIPADLVSRVLKKDTAYLCAKSYSGEKTEDIQNKEIVFSREIATTVKNMKGNLLLIDDLLDSSRTMKEAVKFLKNYPPLKGKIKNIKTAAIWRKPKAVNFPCDYVVEDLKEDRWIVQPFEESESLTIEDLKKKLEK